MTGTDVSNGDVILWALFELEGESQFVDVEEVYLRAFELAPRKFGWRTHPEFPQFKTCALAMGEVGRRSPRPVINQGENLRRLSVEGLKWIQENYGRLAEDLGRDRDVQPPKTNVSRRLVRQVRETDVYQMFESSGEVPEEKWRIAMMFRCAPDSPAQVFNDRLETLRSSAYVLGDSSVLELLDAIKETRKEWFE